MRHTFSALAFFGIVTHALPAAAQDTAPAQPPPCEHAHRGGGGGQLITALGLDEHQAATVRQIFVDTRSERRRIRALPRGSADRIAARQQLMQSVRARIDAILSESQRARLVELRAERRGHAGMGRRAPRAGI